MKRVFRLPVWMGLIIWGAALLLSCLIYPNVEHSTHGWTSHYISFVFSVSPMSVLNYGLTYTTPAMCGQFLFLWFLNNRKLRKAIYGLLLLGFQIFAAVITFFYLQTTYAGCFHDMIISAGSFFLILNVVLWSITFLFLKERELPDYMNRDSDLLDESIR